MKNTVLLLTLLISLPLFSQEETHRKGEIFIYWGWNRSIYTNSDIHFKGNSYDFTLYDVAAKDKQNPFSFKKYFGITSITIPQYNFRLGVYLNSKYSISLGVDHMKYVMKNYQNVLISGSIKESGTDYDGSYREDTINLSPDFLLFEHTDGLNYENIEIRRSDNLFVRDKFRIESVLGAGVGIMLPRTNATLMNNERYDEFHLAGYGLGLTTGLQFVFFRHFFIQFEGKGGFIHMPDIRTTKLKSDKASQHFFFGQVNGVFGANFHFKKPVKKEPTI